MNENTLGVVPFLKLLRKLIPLRYGKVWSLPKICYIKKLECEWEMVQRSKFKGINGFQFPIPMKTNHQLRICLLRTVSKIIYWNLSRDGMSLWWRTLFSPMKRWVFLAFQLVKVPWGLHTKRTFTIKSAYHVKVHSPMVMWGQPLLGVSEKTFRILFESWIPRQTKKLYLESQHKLSPDKAQLGEKKSA